MKPVPLEQFLPFAPAESSITGENRRSYLVYYLCWMWAAVITILLVIRMLINHAFLVHDLTIILTLDITFTITLLVNRKGNSSIAAYLFIVTCVVLTTAAAFISGGVTTPAMMTYPPAIFAGGILFGKRGGVVTAAVCISVTFIMLLLQVNGLVPVSPLFRNPVAYWLGFVAAALVMGVLQYIVNHQTSLAFEKITHQEELYHSLVEQASDPILLSNEDTSIIEANSSACKILGYTRDELLQMKLTDVFSREEIQKRPLQLDYLRKHKTILTERQWTTKDRRTLDMEVHTRVLEGQGYLSIARDITERKAIAKKLRESEEKHRALTENLSDAIILINEKGKIIYQSAAVGRIGGYASEEIKDETIFEFIHPEDVPRSIELFKKAQALPGVPLNGQYRSLHKDGRYIWIEGTITNLLHNESVNAYIINYHDITERVKYLNDIEEQNKKLREIAWIQSHVVRAPLARMMGLVNVLREIEMDPDEFEKWVGFFNTTADELDAIVHDISVKAKDIPVEQ